MGISQDPRTPSDFERFRRDRNLRRNQRHITVARGDRVQRDTIRQIEERERSEALEQRLTREMYEFVEETTRLAATILKEIAAQHQQNRANQISSEMHEFFSETFRRAESLTRYLHSIGSDAGSLQIAISEMEPLLENLSTEALDEFRAEGTAEGQRHMGRHPVAHRSPLEGRLSDPMSEPPLSEEELLEEEFEDDEGYGENPDGSFDLEPLASDEFFEDDVDEGRRPLEDPLSWRPSERLEAEAAAAQPAQVAPEPEARPEPEPEPAADGPDLPLGLGGVAHDPAKLKKALTLMVKNGLMTKEDANAAWKTAREFARSRPARGGDPA